MGIEELVREALQDPAWGPAPDFRERVMTRLPPRQRVRLAPLRALAAPLGAALVVAAALVVGSLVSGIVPEGVPPSSARPNAGATPVASATAPATNATYADGVPREIDGRPVLRGDAIRREVVESQDDRPFLVGGYFVEVLSDCFLDPDVQDAQDSQLLAPCGDGFHLTDAPIGLGFGLGPRLVVGAGLGSLPDGRPGVLRAHVQDPRAAGCAPELRQPCEYAIVVDAVMWVGPVTFPLGADGIPLEIGDEIVLRGGDIVAAVEAAQDDEPFLIGGWATSQIAYRCPGNFGQRFVYEPLLPCGSGAFQVLEEPDGDGGVVIRAAHGPAVPAPGAVVLRVHVNDALAATCPANMRTLCDETIVLDDIVWNVPSDSRSLPRTAP